MNSFEQALENHLHNLYKLALNYTHNTTKAEDLVNDTALRALSCRDHFTEGSNFTAWVDTILTNLFMRYYRRSKREQEIMEQIRLNATEYSYESVPEKPLSDDMVVALMTLPDDLQQVVMLCDIQGCRYKEAAQLMHCPIGTIMSRLHRARRLLGRRISKIAS